MKKLLEQAIKFGFVGGLCFLIDTAIGTVLLWIFKDIIGKDLATALGGFVGFTISVIVNYILSMKFVFERKEDMSRRKEFIIFIILSIIGLGLTEVILIVFSKVYDSSAFISGLVGDEVWYIISKIVSTAIVMVYNFVSRKIFLEKKD